MIKQVLFGVLYITASITHAAPVIYYGEDLGGGDWNVPSATGITNSLNAQISFLSAIQNPGIESFETIPAGTSSPTIAFGNGVTAQINGANVEGEYLSTTNGLGRYGVTALVENRYILYPDYYTQLAPYDGIGAAADYAEMYLEAAEGFSLTFSQGISAFGFYGIDIGDFDGTLTLTTSGGLNQTFEINSLIELNKTNGGGVMFWGLIDTEATFTSITFGNTAAGFDVFAFDDFTIGTYAQVSTVPVPPAVWLFSSGLIGLIGISRRNKS